MHTGQNLNGSFFSKEVVEKAIPTLANTPILSFIEDNAQGDKDFSDHRMALKRSEDGDYSFKYLGSAVGVIPETNNAHWEMRVTDSGEEKEYLVVDALMWTKWDDPTDIMTAKGTTAQSMELADDYTGFYDENNIFRFDTFKFWGACLLGEGVQPAMQNSTAELQFTESAKATQKTIENKLEEFYTLFSQQGGIQMAEEVKETEQEFEATIDETTETQVEEVETEMEATDEVEVQVEEAPESETKVEEEVAEQPVEEVEEAEVEEETVEAVEVIDYEAKFNELQSEFTSLESKLEELKSYKRSREEEDMKSQFSEKLSDDEMAQVFEAMKESSMEEIEVKLFALYGKKNFSTNKTVTQTVNKVAFSLPKDDNKVDNPYGDIFEK